MSKRAEQMALKAYPKAIRDKNGIVIDIGFPQWIRDFYIEGYEQAEKDLAPAFEFSFDVPDNDGYLVFTAMDNQTIRKVLKLKKGEGIIVSIRKDK